MTEQAPITDRTIGEYLETLGSSRPDPGGGSVAGLVGALGAALGQMVISLTVNKAPNLQLDERSAALAQAIASLLASAEADEQAYSGYLQATRLPKTSDAEKATRRAAMQAELVNAADVPLTLATTAGEVLVLLDEVAREGTSHALSDAEIGVSLAEASVLAGLANVRINIPLIKDTATAADLARRADHLEATARQRATDLRDILANRRQT